MIGYNFDLLITFIIININLIKNKNKYLYMRI